MSKLLLYTPARGGTSCSLSDGAAILIGMRTSRFLPGAAGLLFLGLGMVGCDQHIAAQKRVPSKPGATTAPEPTSKRIQIGKNVFVEVRGKKKRVLINAYVCQQRAMLEQLLTRKMTKEHEAVLAADADARLIHAALLLAGAEPGHPVQYQPYKPASGTVIKVYVQYKDKAGKVHTLPAQKWVRHIKTKKDLEYDWVFAGSRLDPPPDPKLPPFYEANNGDVICVSNFDTAMLDLPIASSKDNDQLEFEANSDRIPALGTPVTVILEPVLPAKKQKK
jgi:hypothetical protein